ncbi:L-rhamnose mutarotase [Flammeovirga pacifica]|uniref:L-rhamnose mutarotase n=1 Tax=Flammeovirga pacifica TaxID=915059 RepID=A0A1S1YTW3_FLAPC|nr:L-rhamnose mutarotase [Flammeovirga pacifica]OHX64474.1 L-rhamnose mutarotase [Flammeovirga pacifica]
MKTLAFKMKLKPGMKSEYIRRHDLIWPELKALLQEYGINEYFIFLDEETDILFAFQKVVGNKNSQDLGHNEVVQKWWEYMADIMITNDDLSPESIELEEVFQM